MIRNILETKENVIDASSFREPKKVPVGISYSGWGLAYAGVTYRDVENDPEKFRDAYCKILNDISVDFNMSSHCPGIPYKAVQALESDAFGLSEDGTAVTHNQAGASYLGPEVYDLIKDDLEKVLNETRWKMKYPIFEGPKEKAYNAVIRSLKEIRTFTKANDLIAEFQRDNGILTFSTPYAIGAPFNYLFDQLRGIRNALTDIRRYPDKVQEASDIIWERDKKWLAMDSETAENPLPLIMNIVHVECMLSPKQYDQLAWKYIKDGVGDALRAGKKFLLFGEGTMMHIYDKFREFPKGSFIIMPDADDPFEVHKKIGDWATIMCGANTTLMASGSKEQCTDYVKRCFDTFAPGGGFIFSTNQLIVSSKDAKTENLLAVYETADKLSKGSN